MIRGGRGAKHLFFYGGLLVAMLSLVFFAAPALADTVIGTAGDGWQTWTQGNVNENGAPFWDHSSFDGSHFNVGYYLTNSGAFAPCSSNCGPGVLPFWGATYNSGTDSGGVADPKVYFSTSDPGQNAALKLEVTANTNSNEIGWFETDSTGTVNGTKHTLFTGPQGAGATATFTPTAFYGYYIISGTLLNGGPAHETFYTISSFDNTSSTTPQTHFAIFKQGDPSYWIGVEDLITTCIAAGETTPTNPACINGTLGSDFDYNDEVFVVSPVPEPGTMLLGGTGLVWLAFALRRRFFSR